MHIRECAGAIILNSKGEVALVRNRAETLWFFPKGGVDDGESLEEAALREVREETGLTSLEYLDTFEPYERPKIEKDGSYSVSESKRIHMFLYSASETLLSPSLEIVDAMWCPLARVPESLEDAKDKVWFTKVFRRVREAVQRD